MIETKKVVQIDESRPKQRTSLISLSQRVRKAEINKLLRFGFENEKKNSWILYDETEAVSYVCPRSVSACRLLHMWAFGVKKMNVNPMKPTGSFALSGRTAEGLKG
ncbi:hypothetical protein NE237_023025 [Protea cynaroides]|uniref:Uncharacterized protein n=1 Tax=Protea cynaroides TaxID=273540 RepID=A0A9Q0HD33_9MAGN|nr:hypothetical protein NE237_023025 [Protea cynaroides]